LFFYFQKFLGKGEENGNLDSSVAGKAKSAMKQKKNVHPY
jgi:hypothetical protein